MRLVAIFPVLLIGTAFVSDNQPVNMIYSIPTQTFNPWLELGKKYDEIITVDSFSITSQITLGQYKEFLNSVRTDSGEVYYRNHLPDSDMCTHEAYVKYMHTPEYDNYPVSGVTWRSASHYCEWRTHLDHLDSTGMLYRLPFLAEWLAADRYLTKHTIPNDFSANYTDWLIEAMDETPYYFLPSAFHNYMEVVYTYPDIEGDLPVLRRKRMMGNSFKFQHSSLGDHLNHYGYAFEGYAHVSFRMVKVPMTLKGHWRVIPGKSKAQNK